MIYLYYMKLFRLISIFERIITDQKLQTPEKLDLQSTCRGNAVHELERKPKSDIGLIIYFNTSCKKYIQSRDGGRKK